MLSIRQAAAQKQQMGTPLPVAIKSLADKGVHFRAGQVSLIAASSGTGKALGVETPIATPDGWSTMGALRVGDKVYDEQGKPCNVTGKSRVWNDETYRVVFNDRSEIVAHGNHEWQVVHGYRPENLKAKGEDWRSVWALSETKTTKELAANLGDSSGHLLWRVPNAMPLEGAGDLPIDPYVLGCWLADGTSRTGGISINDGTKAGIPAEWLSRGYDSHEIPSQPTEAHGRHRTIPSLVVKLRDLNLLQNKHIPSLYLRASKEDRLDLLRGIMDGDGFRAIGNSVGVDMCDERLVDDIAELVRTLGWTPRVRRNAAAISEDGTRRIVGARWRLNFRPDVDAFLVRSNGGPVPVAQQSRHTARSIVSIERIGDAPTQCIEVDSPSHLFLAGESMIPTHNSVVAHWIALYAGVPTLYMSADSDQSTMGIRTGSMLTGIHQDIVEKQIEDEEGQGWDALNQARHIEWSFDRGITLNDVIEEMKAFYTAHGVLPELVIIDNLRNLADEEGLGDRDHWLNTLEEAHVLAAATKAHIMFTHHVTGYYDSGDRAVPKAGLENKTSQTPEVILTMFSPVPGQLFVSIVKNRGGEHRGDGSFGVTLGADFARMQLASL